ncbi:PIN domain-containing protein [Micromonospora sp. WMMD980]|uniref:PIN-like domain-containing protein n=1 Tax=Micromonospora sp. WMMD980 TaxID=3016088 RepID=UPI002416C1E5|nr:PIN domain-containing protein [Micromonospora sp. WMMD980]MDG4803140.1 PIN-like domain-containing protein [Micromonospora sp. WMMD980]
MADTRQETGRGLFDGFEGYRTPTAENYKEVLLRGMVVPDANVLLNLYRYNTQTRKDLFAVFGKLGARLWVPHQVAREFWRNRESASRDLRDSANGTIATLEENRNRALQEIRTWANRIALPSERIASMRKLLEGAFEAVVEEVSEVVSAETLGPAADTNRDSILQYLEAVLDQRVGQPLDAALEPDAVKEGLRRIAEEIPPGYKDKGKSDGREVGDYLLWAQVLEEAERRKCDVLIVTGDVKEDWWRKERGELRGPRLELIAELRRRTGCNLYMLRPDSLLIHAKDVLRLAISDKSVQEVERVERSLSTGFSTDGSGSDGRFLLDKLPEGRKGGYLNIIAEMTRLARDSPGLDEFLSRFQDRFPSITLKDVARRRMRVLVSLGLANIADNSVVLTSFGRALVREPRLEALQEAMLSRIQGAAEVMDLAQSYPMSELRAKLHAGPPAGLSATQARLVLRWLEQLELI